MPYPPPIVDGSKEKELAQNEEMSEQGFADWNRRDFQQFVNGSARYGRKNYDGIAEEVEGKTRKKSEIQNATKTAVSAIYINFQDLRQILRASLIS